MLVRYNSKLMQVLLNATNSREVSADRCAVEILDAIPEVMWTLRRHMRQRRAKGLSVPQFRALCLIRKFPTASMSAVSDHLGSTLPTASRLVGGLVDRGLISRKSSSDDRRQVELNLTARGNAILDVAREGTLAAIADKMVALSPRERATVSAALALITNAMGRASIEPETTLGK